MAADVPHGQVTQSYCDNEVYTLVIPATTAQYCTKQEMHGFKQSFRGSLELKISLRRLDLSSRKALVNAWPDSVGPYCTSCSEVERLE